jgi:RimJ/RimL family protein N-acetyltransferase
MEFELQPHLIGELVELRPLRADDFDALYAVASDPLIWEVHPEPDRYKEDIFRRFFATATESGGAFLVIDRKTSDVIGSSRYSHLDPVRSEIEIGWTFLARKYWGGRYNQEMKRLMLEHAFKFVDRVVFLVGPQNFRSRRAVEKIGGMERGRRIVDGRESVVYEITAERFIVGPLTAAREAQTQRAVRE